jgi:hypothetical protein
VYIHVLSKKTLLFQMKYNIFFIPLGTQMNFLQNLLWFIACRYFFTIQKSNKRKSSRGLCYGFAIPLCTNYWEILKRRGINWSPTVETTTWNISFFLYCINLSMLCPTWVARTKSSMMLLKKWYHQRTFQTEIVVYYLIKPR